LTLFENEISYYKPIISLFTEKPIHKNDIKLELIKSEDNITKFFDESFNYYDLELNIKCFTEKSYIDNNVISLRFNKLKDDNVFYTMYQDHLEAENIEQIPEEKFTIGIKYDNMIIPQKTRLI
jgi:hypothetical protein